MEEGFLAEIANLFTKFSSPPEAWGKAIATNPAVALSWTRNDPLRCLIGVNAATNAEFEDWTTFSVRIVEQSKQSIGDLIGKKARLRQPLLHLLGFQEHLVRMNYEHLSRVRSALQGPPILCIDTTLDRSKKLVSVP
jgi:hypothetical protein